MPLIFSADHEEDQERYYLQRLVERSVDGLIIASASVTTQTIDEILKPLQVPYLLFDQNDTPDGDRIEVDNDQGGYLVAKHLAKEGHQKITLLFPKNVKNIEERQHGFVRGLAEEGIDFDPASQVVYGTLTKQGGYEATDAVLATKPTAVFAANDEMAIGLYRGLAERGVKVPDDISVVGFDGIDLDRYVTPQLTTVAQPIEELGEKASALLLTRISNPQAPTQQISLPVELVVRSSTAAVK